MAKYIDIDLLKKEIDRLGEIEYLYSYDQCVGFYDALDRIESFINSFQQEQPEVDLEEEIDSEWKKCLPIDEGMGVEVANIHIEAFDIIARHFYALGQSMMRKRFTDPEYNQRVIEKMKSEYPADELNARKEE